MAKNFIVRKSTKTIFVKEAATEEERRELMATYGALGWEILPSKSKSKDVVPHEITKEFNIPFDEVRKADMLKYVKEFVEDKAKIAEFANAAYSTTKGVPTKTKDGKLVYNHLAAKRGFFKAFFPERWIEIEKVLESRKFKKAKKEEPIFDLEKFVSF